jgi:glycosyltransferase involved in cell wall biosynthesis
MNSPALLSIVSPVYGAAALLDELVERIIRAAGEVTADFEVLLVDDGSPDGAWAHIVRAGQRDPRVKGIRLTRNFGQHRAIAAGIANASGEFIIVMDCDLQDDPCYIPQLVAKAREGFDVVLTRKRERRHSWLRNLGARWFFRAFNALADRGAGDPRIGGYSLLSRRVADAYLRIADVHRHHLLLLGWLGFPPAVVDVEHHYRPRGQSAYTTMKLFRHALEGITSQSTKLLKVSVAIGFAYFFAAVLGVVYLVASYFIHGFRAGWASTFVLLLGSTGLMLMAIGVLGIYLGNIFEQVRTRPLYLIHETVNLPPPPR